MKKDKKQTKIAWGSYGIENVAWNALKMLPLLTPLEREPGSFPVIANATCQFARKRKPMNSELWQYRQLIELSRHPTISHADARGVSTFLELLYALVSTRRLSDLHAS